MRLRTNTERNRIYPSKVFIPAVLQLSTFKTLKESTYKLCTRNIVPPLP